MLPAAPPKLSEVLALTSTNTVVDPSLAMRSISPSRQRELRSRIVSPCPSRKAAARASGPSPRVTALARDLQLALLELRCGEGARKEMIGAQRDPADDTVQCDVCPAGEQLLRDAEGVYPERIKAVEVRVAVIGARIDHHRRMVGLQQPWHVEEAYVREVESGERTGVAAGIDVRGRVERERPKIRAHGARAREIE